MFNPEQKLEFIRNYTGSLNTSKVAQTIFTEVEKYETAWGADLCTRSTEELQPVVDAISGLRSSSKWMYITILKEYVKWCIAMGVPDACDGMLHVNALGIDKVRRQMVASPMHLQRYLDAICDKETEETIDNVYRCYFWMAYGGVDEEDTVRVRRGDVDLSSMTIRYETVDVPIYREAVRAFEMAVRLDSFRYLHPKYETRIERTPGDTILRGIKAPHDQSVTIRHTISKRNARLIREGGIDLQLSFSRVRLSGIFYRTYERERIGIQPDFSYVASSDMEGKEYTLSNKSPEETIECRRRVIEREYRIDYQRWKLAFISV